MLGRSVVLCFGLLAVLVPVRRARACGPDFPPILLDDRGGTLRGLPEGTFADEMTRLVPKPGDAFQLMELGEEPPEARTGGGTRETELYQAGARAFNAGNLAQARARFREVLALPAGERRRFGPFAAFMLGRMAPSLEEAQRYFNEVRELVRQGSDDPLGLAVASLGEEGRALLREGKDVEAARRYAEQASYGSQIGALSLLRVARALARDEVRLKRALQDPLGQRLLTTYVWTRKQDTWWDESDERQRPMPGLLDALAELPEVAGADRLAAAAWRAGRFDLAERFAGKQQSPLDTWVRAKLKLRQGNQAEADRLMAEAAAQFTPTEGWLNSFNGMPYTLYPSQRLEAEQGVLALSQGHFMEAAEHLLASCSWPDLAYVTERVLTLEELQRFVASHSTVKPCPTENPWSEADIRTQLRELLGRRLLRGGKGREALPFFQGTPMEAQARAYVEALERGRTPGGDATERARALYAAALFARHSGLELLATEVAPDWAWVGADYDLDDEDVKPIPGDAASPEAAQQALNETKALTTQEEAQRYIAHAPAHPVRFQYRSTAADLAEEAAALVPPRSQAYAALLCQAARFSSRSEPERTARLWKTYIQKGALLQEAWAFGQQCPEPDFARLAGWQESRPARKQHWRKRTLAVVTGVVLLPVVAVGFLLLRRRRAKS
ncbi:hypothetical protein [Hyalangium rubrum]|uniref:Tetratricopeptide repeat domain protein n=1 Tax=Hyalangium rubrum TaxID=3103134 RepID=A0ABU5H8Z5_9BACT|nr:hypothetical protein [Hyalangium sp. s54d21]MDY7229597.1 hypothetical protein [Hyalangium sp. s54d21]